MSQTGPGAFFIGLICAVQIAAGASKHACVVVRDANEQVLAYVYFEDEPGRRAAAKLLTRDEARRITANIAKLPDLLALQASALSTKSICTCHIRRAV